MIYRNLALAVSAIALMTAAPAVNAETVTTHTIIKNEELPGVNRIPFSAFDLNNDNILSMHEVGERLFRSFDRDANHNIDNIEFDTKSVMTIIPMEKETFTFVDYNSDGVTDVTNFTAQNFIQQSGLMRFDENKDGLTPAEFIQMGYRELDDDDDNMINLEEWREAYLISVRPKSAEQERYNY